MKNNNIKTFVAIGIGAALFFVLGRFVAIPSPVPNTNISLQYAVLGLLAAMYGPVAGGLIGFIGHALIDLSWGGIPWWSWVIASAFTGVVVGLFAKKLNLQEGDFNKRQGHNLHHFQRHCPPDRLDRGCSGAGHPHLCRACQEGLRPGRFRSDLQHHHRCCRRRPAGAGLHQDHRQEGLFGQGVNPYISLVPSHIGGKALCL